MEIETRQCLRIATPAFRPPHFPLILFDFKTNHLGCKRVRAKSLYNRTSISLEKEGRSPDGCGIVHTDYSEQGYREESALLEGRTRVRGGSRDARKRQADFLHAF